VLYPPINPISRQSDFSPDKKSKRAQLHLYSTYIHLQS
jgi:hypothetical protein